jgi:6-phosphogluconolactonase/glucosamine-6-phosphate isomerase/deaminase
VPPDDERSNFGMAKRTLIDNLIVQPRAVHRIRGEAIPRRQPRCTIPRSKAFVCG